MQCVILVGIQHSGKTTAGRLLAARKGFDFFDIDLIIERLCGTSCRELYAQKGEAAFKKAELEACRLFQAACAEKSKTNAKGVVCAAGGGICDNARALSILKKTGTCVYLDIGEEEAFSRICARAAREGSFPAYIERHKPQTDERRREIFHAVYERRTAEYKKKAALSVNADGLSPEHICAAIEKLPVLNGVKVF